MGKPKNVKVEKEEKMAENYEKKKKISKLKLAIIIILLLLFVAGGALGAYFLLKTDDSFEVGYNVKVAATVSGKYVKRGEEVNIGEIVFNPEDKDQESYQILDAGEIKLDTRDREITFTYTFANTDSIGIKVTLSDNAVRNNVKVTQAVYKEGVKQEIDNLSTGFIMNPNEKWTVDFTISVINMDQSARYTSSEENSLTWTLVEAE